ncbi:hypothetical protein [Microbulbifer pacificus]|uniref:DUF3828 domain-containing protein n=1 Tax=Microbulbifer pacificus TaxID=407164 RepID=A0AAU0MWB8_9GAMM|nr:hypothetical protein [Microbulbifer pacificus]WOX04330.1 hypothetical protein R5R33_11315 [Microbulbifer pacificus]
MKKAILAVLLFFGVIATASANDALIAERLKEYWAAYSSTDFVKAAEFILPADLNDLKSELLPVFLAANESQDVEVRQMAQYFFADIPPGKYTSMTSSDVFSAMNTLMAGLSPDMFSLLQGAELEVVSTSKNADGSVAVNVAIKVAGDFAEDVMYLRQENGEWFMRVNEKPSVTANGFRQLFGQ